MNKLPSTVEVTVQQATGFIQIKNLDTIKFEVTDIAKIIKAIVVELLTALYWYCCNNSIDYF